MNEKSNEISFSEHYTYEELTQILKDIAKKHSELTRLKSIGKSTRNRDIWLMEITNFKTGLPESKPGIWIDGNTHGGEVTSSILCLKMMWVLINKYNEDASIKDLLDLRCFYILPRLNPDGAELYLTTPLRQEDVWGCIPNPQWSEAEGIYGEDLNSDGWVTKMRIRDLHGDWKISDRDPRLMIKRETGDDDGEYFKIYPEGLIKNYNGLDVKIAPPRWLGGSNRNYPANWAPAGVTPGTNTGPFPLWEPEPRAQADFVYEHQNISLILSNHTPGGVILRAYATKEDSWFIENGLKGDLDTYKALGALGEEITGYPCVSTFGDYTKDKSKPRRGSAMDWWYEHWGVYAFTNELWDMAKEAGIGGFWERGGSNFKRDALSEEDGLKTLEWNDRVLKGEGFIDWRLFNHPQLGQVEIGGWKYKYTWQNPPIHKLENEIDKFLPFLLRASELTPLIRIIKTNVTPIADNVYKITALVENQGFLPTNVTDQAKNVGIAKPVNVTIELDNGIKLLSGRSKVELGHLTGKSYKLPTIQRDVEKSKKSVEWVVDISEAMETIPEPNVWIHAISEKGGKCSKKTSLQKRYRHKGA